MTELFKRTDIVVSQDKSRKLSDKQWLAIKRDRVVKYFCESWQKKYSLNYVIPPKSFMTVEKPISDALASNYTPEMLCQAIDAYLSNDFIGYVENSHPIRFFTKDITRWVMQGKKEVKMQETKPETDLVREMNFKYGIIKKGESYIDEEGNVYVDSTSAIKAVEKRRGNLGKTI